MGSDLSQPDPFPIVPVSNYATDLNHLGPVVEPAFMFTEEPLLTEADTLVVDVVVSDGATVAETTLPEVDVEDDGDVAVTALVPEEGDVVTEVLESGPSPTVPLASVVEAAFVVPVFPVVVTVVVVVVVVVVLVPLLPDTVLLLLLPEVVPPGDVTESELSDDPVDACVTETPSTELVHSPSLLNLYSVPSMVRVLFFCILPSLK